MARRRDPVAVVASPPAAGRRDRGLIRQVPRAIDATVQASLLLTILFDESDEPAGDARAGCVKRVFATMGNDGEGAVGEYRKLWWVLIAVLTVTFAILGVSGVEIYRKAPPIPAQVVSASGEVLMTRDDILTGQTARSEERRVGEEFVSTCRSRWTTYP